MNRFCLERKGAAIITALRSRGAKWARRARARHRRPAAAAKHEYASGKRIFGQRVLAESRQRIDALASVHRLNRHQHAHLRRDLDQESISHSARLIPATSAVAAPLSSIRSLPRGLSSSSTHSRPSGPCAPISSTKSGATHFFVFPPLFPSAASATRLSRLNSR